MLRERERERERGERHATTRRAPPDHGRRVAPAAPTNGQKAYPEFAFGGGGRAGLRCIDLDHTYLGLSTCLSLLTYLHSYLPAYMHTCKNEIASSRVEFILKLEGKYSLESTDPRESEIRAHLRP